MYKPILGTVTLRDFCNREETKIPPYFEVISVIDHHKTQLYTGSAPVVIIADSQSSNVLCAEVAFAINDQYAKRGNKESLKEQIETLKKQLPNPSANRCLQRILKRQLAAESPFFIDLTREYSEYLHFLYGILDDTDLLTKVSQRDVECVAELLNRLKSLMLGKEVETIWFDDLPRDHQFVKKAAARILQNPDMYSMYRKIYLAKERMVEENMKLCANREPSTFFIDTKEQNRCARVGQTKMFASNYPTFVKYSTQLREHWVDNAIAFNHGKGECSLHIHMISTVAGAEELFAGKQIHVTHSDELWFWIPFSDESVEHLKSFLNAFSGCSAVKGKQFAAEFYGVKAKEYEAIFAESFLPLSKKSLFEKTDISIAVLKFEAGLVNSRKAMISPIFPRPSHHIESS